MSLRSWLRVGRSNLIILLYWFWDCFGCKFPHKDSIYYEATAANYSPSYFCFLSTFPNPQFLSQLHFMPITHVLCWFNLLSFAFYLFSRSEFWLLPTDFFFNVHWKNQRFFQSIHSQINTFVSPGLAWFLFEQNTRYLPSGLKTGNPSKPSK